jgi:hypothetical protein
MEKLIDSFTDRFDRKRLPTIVDAISLTDRKRQPDDQAEKRGGSCRPHVSDDNPYSESQYRTMKYRPEFPDRFGCIQDSRAFAQEFFRWCN